MAALCKTTIARTARCATSRSTRLQRRMDQHRKLINNRVQVKIGENSYKDQNIFCRRQEKSDRPNMKKPSISILKSAGLFSKAGWLLIGSYTG